MPDSGSLLVSLLMESGNRAGPGFTTSTRVMYKFFDVLAPVIAPIATPKRTRVEHWPMNR